MPRVRLALLRRVSEVSSAKLVAEPVRDRGAEAHLRALEQLWGYVTGQGV